MSLFGAISIAGTGISANQTWLDTISSNIANVNDTASPASPIYQEQQVLVGPSQSQPFGTLGTGVANQTDSFVGSGVAVTGIVTDKPNGQLTYQPQNPLANAQGMVKTPGIQLSDQLANLDIAGRSYQANAAVINHAKAAYQSVLALGA